MLLLSEVVISMVIVKRIKLGEEVAEVDRVAKALKKELAHDRSPASTHSSPGACSSKR